MRSSSHTPSNKAQILAMPQFGLRDNLIRCELLKNEDLYTYLEDFRYFTVCKIQLLLVSVFNLISKIYMYLADGCRHINIKLGDRDNLYLGIYWVYVIPYIFCVIDVNNVLTLWLGLWVLSNII